MTNLRAALSLLTEALEAHLAAALVAGDDGEAVEETAATLAEAFEAYDEVLYQATGYDTPLDVLDDYQDDDFDEEDLDDDLDDDLDEDDLDEEDLDDDSYDEDFEDEYDEDED